MSSRELRHEPFSLRSWMRAYHACAHLARERAWARRAAGLGLRLLSCGSHSAVVSCGPPHMVHEGARLLARAAHLPLVLDLRDPWSAVERLPEFVASPAWIRIARFYEARAVREADLVVMNTEPAQRAMQTLYPESAQGIIAVMNGCDEETLPVVERKRRFLIAYAGTVYLDRDPSNLFRAAARVVRDLRLPPADFGIELMGDVGSLDGRPMEQLAAELGLDGFVRVHSRGTRGEAMEFLAGATMLVSLPQDSHLAIPSKVFEYMRYEAWLLALASRDSATDLLLRDTDADVAAPDDVDGITAVLRRRYLEHADGRRPQVITDAARFSRRTQAERLFAAIEHITGSPASVPLEST